jgi:hypothetical protein
MPLLEKTAQINRKEKKLLLLLLLQPTPPLVATIKPYKTTQNQKQPKTKNNQPPQVQHRKNTTLTKTQTPKTQNPSTRKLCPV